MQCSPFGVAHSALTVGGGRHHDAAPLARQDQVALWVRSKDVLRCLVFDNYLPRNELPVADEAIGFRCEHRAGDREKDYE